MPDSGASAESSGEGSTGARMPVWFGEGASARICQAQNRFKAARTGSIPLIVEIAATRSAISPPTRPPRVPAPAICPK